MRIRLMKEAGKMRVEFAAGTEAPVNEQAGKKMIINDKNKNRHNIHLPLEDNLYPKFLSYIYLTPQINHCNFHTTEAVQVSKYSDIL